MSSSATIAPKRALFDIGEDLIAFDNLLEDVGGDVSDPSVESTITNWFTTLSGEESRKLDGYLGYIKTLEGEATVAQAEKEQFETKVRTRKSRIEFLKARLKQHLEATKRTQVKTLAGRTIAIQANGGKLPVDIDQVDPATLPERFTKTTVTINREAVAAALEAGEVLEFARLGTRGTQLRIK